MTPSSTPGDRSVLVAYDGRCPTTLRGGAALARGLGAEITIASAYAYEPVSRSARPLADPVGAERAADAARLVEEAAASVPGLPGTRVVPAVDVRESVLDLAAELDAGAIVLGPDLHGRVTRRIAAAAERPVLVVPEIPQLVADEYSEIGVGYDGSVPSTAALAAAADIARRTGARLRLVVVCPESEPSNDLAETAERAARRTAAGLDVTVDVRLGNPGVQLREVAAQLDLLVCGARRRGRVLRALLGGVSSDLLELPNCPTLLVPAGWAGAVEDPPATEPDPDTATASLPGLAGIGRAGDVRHRAAEGRAG